MRLLLTSKGDYSVRAVLDLSTAWGRGRRKAREIAAAMDIPDNYVTQILAGLVRSEILTAVAGPDGGYSLARPPDEITLLQVVEAAQGAITLDQCVLRGGSCDWINKCPVHDMWARAQDAMAEVLAASTFAEMAEIDAAMVAGTYDASEDKSVHRIETDRHGATRA